MRVYAGGQQPEPALQSFASSATSSWDHPALVQAGATYASMGNPKGEKNVALNEPVRGYPHVLQSYAYDRDGSFFPGLGYTPPNWLGDSGAFTVWTVGGEPIRVDQYVEWCLRYREQHPPFACINLDVIPGTVSGKAPSKREKKRAMDESLANADAMRTAGLLVWEVYHLHEPVEYLDQLLDRRQPGEVVGIGGIAGKAAPSVKVAFCDSVFAHCRDRYGWDNLPPFHALGVAPEGKLGRRYPWRSMDSSSWLSPTLYGFKPGKLGGRDRDDKRTTAKPVRLDYLVRALEAWLRLEVALREMWTRRGVVLQP